MNIQSLLKSRSPSILAGLGIVGFITATIMAAKVAPRASKVIEEEEERTFMEKSVAVAPLYAPAVGMMMISTAAIVASNHINSARYASVLALYAVSERTLTRWQEAVIDEVGPKKKELIRKRTTEPHEEIPQSLVVDGNRMLFFDVFTGRYFRADSLEAVRRVVNESNEFMIAEDFISLNEYYMSLGMPTTGFGEDVGWTASDGLIDIHYDSHIKDDTPCVSMQFVNSPTVYNAH